jgi:hypothetical protein
MRDACRDRHGRVGYDGSALDDRPVHTTQHRTNVDERNERLPSRDDPAIDLVSMHVEAS